jgi:hypothetical protein
MVVAPRRCVVPPSYRLTPKASLTPLSIVWLCHKSGKALKLKENLRRFWARLESKKVFYFNCLTINLTMFMTQS